MVGKIMGTKQTGFEITGTDLKFIAVITMLIDHMGVALVANMIRQGIEPFSFIAATDLYHVMRYIGRMAFPIYCYMLVEGFLHTRNIKKYGLRLLLVALISEIPFNLVSRSTLFTFERNNVLWELLVGLIVLYVTSEIEKKPINTKLIYVSKILVLLAGMLFAYLTNLDYGPGGICCIAVMYAWRGNGTKMDRLISFATGVAVLAVCDGSIEVWAFLMLIPMYFYEGNRGLDNKALRLFFYLFYPVHLLILGLIANLFIL